MERVCGCHPNVYTVTAARVEVAIEVVRMTDVHGRAVYPSRRNPGSGGTLTLVGALPLALGCAESLRPAEESAGEQAIEGLDSDAPEPRRPGRGREQLLLAVSQRVRPIVGLVFQPVAKVFARQQAKPTGAPGRAIGQLEVHDARGLPGAADPVGFLRQVVVGDAVPVNLPKQAQRVAKIGA